MYSNENVGHIDPLKRLRAHTPGSLQFDKFEVTDCTNSIELDSLNHGTVRSVASDKTRKDTGQEMKLWPQDSNEIFYETTYLPQIQHLNTSVPEEDDIKVVSSLVPPCDPIVRVHGISFPVDLAPSNTDIEFRLVNKEYNHLWLYGPLHDVPECHKDVLDDEVALSLILDEEITCLGNVLEVLHPHIQVPLPPEKSPFSRFLSWFHRETEEEKRQAYFNSHPWSKHLYRSEFDDPIMDLEDYACMFSSQVV